MAVTTSTHRQRQLFLPSNRLWRLRKADRLKFQTPVSQGPVTQAMTELASGGRATLTKSSFEAQGDAYFPAGYAGSIGQVSSAPALAMAVLSDPELTPAQRALLMNTVRSARDNLSTPTLVGAAIGAGTGLVGGIVVGKLLGALVGLSPPTQQAIASTGAIAGLLNSAGVFK